MSNHVAMIRHHQEIQDRMNMMIRMETPCPLLFIMSILSRSVSSVMIMLNGEWRILHSTFSILHSTFLHPRCPEGTPALRSPHMNRLLLALLALFALAAAPPPESTVFVDCSDARRGVFHAHVTLPAAPGPMTFVYPKWIPGEHTPTGPLMQMAGLHVRASGGELAWTRDPVELFAFHIDVPQGASSVDIDFDYLSPSTTFGAGYGESA